MTTTVVIPAYNEEKYLKNCLKAVFNQTELADEVIVVDNNSTDKTAAIAQAFTIRLIKEKRQGISYARSAGFNAAKSELILRCDADVIVPPDWIKTYKNIFQDKKIDAATGSASYRGLPINTTRYINLYLDFMKLSQGGKESIIGMNMALRKTIWKKVKNKVNMDNSVVHEDIDLALWIWQAGGRVVYVKDLVVESSARRINKQPWSFFVEYPIRLKKTLQLHDVPFPPFLKTRP